MRSNSAGHTPASFWIITLVSLLWHALGVYDFIMTGMRDSAYLANFPPELVDYLDAMPVWALAAWALTVGGALAGSLLLLLRSRFAVEAFVLSLICLGLGTMYEGANQLPLAMRTPFWMVFNLVVWIGAIGFAMFAVWFRKAGVLR
jgi:hypothetical protein